MKDILRPILELLVVLPGLLLGYFPVKTYLKQSPGRLAAWLFPLMACLCIGSGLQSIARRLALLYGEESTITVESEYMVYTRVTLRMKRGEH